MKNNFIQLLALVSISLIYLISSCTISLTNISTHGTASDVLDEEQGASAQVSPVLSIPAI